MYHSVSATQNQSLVLDLVSPLLPFCYLCLHNRVRIIHLQLFCKTCLSLVLQMTLEVWVQGTETNEPGEVLVSYLPKFSMEGMLLVVFPRVLGNPIEKDVYSKVVFTFLFVQQQLFSSTVSIKQVLNFLRS